MLPTVWFARSDKFDTTWLNTTLTSLHDNTSMGPVYIVGNRWPCVDREDAALALLRALADNTSTTSLILQNAALDVIKDYALTETLRRNTTLQSVTLRHVSHSCNGRRYTVPCELFVSPSMRSISLTHCHLSLEACRSLSTALGSEGKNLSSLLLDDVTFDEAGLIVFFASLSMAHGLQSLTLKNLALDGPTTRRLVMVLGLNRSLESLYLERMAQSTGLANAVAYLIARNRSVQTLSLRDNGLNATDLATICQDGLVHNTFIHTLLLSKNPLGEQGVEEVMRVLEHSTNIHNVCLALTGLGPQGCKAVAKHLPACLHLRHLNLDGNQVEGCAQEFLHALEHSYSILSLFDGLPKLISKSTTCNADWKKVNILLRANQAKRRFFRHADSHADALLPMVLQGAAAQPDVLFHFLQHLGHPWGARAVDVSTSSSLNSSQLSTNY